MKEISCSAGDLILSKNEVSQNLYMVIRGRVRIEIGKEFFFLSDGDLFGEEGLFFNKPSPYNASSVEETAIQVLDHEEAKKHIFENPDVAFTVFIKNFGRTWRNIKTFSESSADYIRIIEELIPYAGNTENTLPDVPAGIGIQDLSKLMKVSSSDLLEDIKRFSDLGHIDVKSGEKIMTVDKKTLRKIVHEHYRNFYFYGTERDKGAGHYSLTNMIRKHNEDIFNGNK